MKPLSADHLLPDELAALMHFYAEAGVGWLSEDQPVDRFAEFAAPAAENVEPPARRQTGGETGRETAGERSRPPAAPAMLAPPPVAVPDSEAVEAARRLAAAAPTGDALIAAVESFAACNLKFSARHTVFAAGNLSARMVVVGGAPAAEDDREGRPFSGAAGRIFERMMTSAGFDPGELLMLNTIPWRTPGDRAPTVREVEICSPFARRLIELVRPEAVLVLGNLAVRILSAEPRAGIHGLRGKWFDLAAGEDRRRAFATFHPEEMVATPACKKLAWQDMLRFRSEFGPSGRASAPDL